MDEVYRKTTTTTVRAALRRTVASLKGALTAAGFSLRPDDRETEHDAAAWVAEQAVRLPRLPVRLVWRIRVESEEAGTSSVTIFHDLAADRGTWTVVACAFGLITGLCALEVVAVPMAAPGAGLVLVAFLLAVVAMKIHHTRLEKTVWRSVESTLGVTGRKAIWSTAT